MLSVNLKEMYYPDEDNCYPSNDSCCTDWCNTKSGVLQPFDPRCCKKPYCPVTTTDLLTETNNALSAICDKLSIVTGETVQDLVVDTVCKVDCLDDKTFVYFTAFIAC